MLNTLEKIKSKQIFLETRFKKYPYNLKKEDDMNSSSQLNPNKDISESQRKELPEKSIEKSDENMNLEKYNEQINKAYKKPVIFQIFEDQPIFKVYNLEQLKDVLSELEQYYSFSIDKKAHNPKDIIELDKENKIEDKVITICPFIAKIFNMSCHRFNFDAIKVISSFEIKKEILEPFSLYIEKKDSGNESNKKFDNNSLDKNLTFIMNKERKQFIKALNDFAGIDIQTEPMVIIGNDGVGKTLTLQLYTLIELEGYKKFYFNLKLFEKCNPRDYFLIELMRGFISSDKNTHKDEFKTYLQYINKYQERSFSNINDIFTVLNEILIDLRFSGKYLIILDQFNFEKISSNDFNNFKGKIPYSKGFKLIICCSLNDDKNKINLFSDYKNIEHYRYLPQFTSSNSKGNVIKPNNIIKKEIDFNVGKISLENFYLLKKRKRDNDKLEDLNSEQKNNNIIAKCKEKGKGKKKRKLGQPSTTTNNINNNNDNDNEGKNNSNNDNNNEGKNNSNLFPEEESNYLDMIFQEDNDENNPSFSDKKFIIYYSNLISLEDMLRAKKESEEVINCMSEFNFIPQYFYKFNLFKAKQNKDKMDNISDLVQSFYKQEIRSIRNNIMIFYSKQNLNQISKDKSINNDGANVYQNLLSLKKCIAKTYEDSINFPKLYKYCLKYPFKYINIKIENKNNEIIFDNNLVDKKFKLRYSFPLIEKIIDKIINEYDNEDKINIKELSGSAYGNALELKIRENLKSLDEKIEIRKVWSLSQISPSVIKEKNDEIKRENRYNRISRFNDLEDIVGIKKLTELYYYFKPENQDNKNFDSIFLIKMGNNFYLVALQITKIKDKRKIKIKEEYSKYLEEYVKTKFKELYKIEITKIFFWFISDNEIIENENLCKSLEDQKIKYLFFSIKNKCFFKERNNTKIEKLNDFINNEAQVFPLKNNNDNNSSLISISPSQIFFFDNMLYEEYQKNNKIFFETIRNKYFKDNYGPKLGDNLKKNIISTIKDVIPYSNDILILFIFSFPFKEFLEFKKFEEDNELVYLFKIKDNIYISFQDKCYQVTGVDNKLVQCDFPPTIMVSLNKPIKYNKSEFDFSSMEDIYSNPLIYLYKIYYLGDELSMKKKN